MYVNFLRNYLPKNYGASCFRLLLLGIRLSTSASNHPGSGVGLLTRLFGRQVMRLAFLLKPRRCLPMQFNRASRNVSSSSQDRTDARPGIKRSFSQQAATQPLPHSPSFPEPPPAKLPRAVDPSGQPSAFSTARHDISRSMASSSRRNQHRSADAGSSHHAATPSSLRSSKRGRRPAASSQAPLKNLLEGPYHDEEHIIQEYDKSSIHLKPLHQEAPKVPVNNFYQIVKNKQPDYVSVSGTIMKGNRKEQIWRTTLQLDIEPPVLGIGDSADKKQSIHLAALSALYQLHERRVLDDPRRLQPEKPVAVTEVQLDDGSTVTYEKARSFMDYYCRKFGFGKPDIDFDSRKGGSHWDAIMTVGDRRIGMGSGPNKKQAQIACFLDVTKYLQSCDPELWETYLKDVRTGRDLGLAPRVEFIVSPALENTIGDICEDIRKTSLYRNRPSRHAVNTIDPSTSPDAPLPTGPRAQMNSFRARRQHTSLETKSKLLLERRKQYLADPKMERMREIRKALPVYSKARDVLDHISNNEVTICMATTGSGKTTQIPQMILDEYIDRGEGAKCNIVCTQPRRLAAISVADRVAKERGEPVGKTIGYHVRFEANLPEPDGSVTFCTTGVFLKRLQSVLSGYDSRGRGEFENITHIVVDEVHERDVDTDLLLVVLKELREQRKAKNQTLKIILMSATIDPTLFQTYFPDDLGAPAKTIAVPGRSFPVTKQFVEDYATKVLSGPMRWVGEQENVSRYLTRELGPTAATKLGVRQPKEMSATADLELPYPFIAATISHVLQSSQDGHVLVFLPGWEEIVATQRALLQPLGPLGINFNSYKYSLHLLHSSIPLAEQQAIFEPPAAGVRRVILATNIAETSVTIPDVVYVIDTAKVKEQKYDPERHMSSLVSAWVGSSNLLQRAGRAGRHRPGEYYGILGKSRADALQPYQTVEMKRVDLSNVVMHVKALNMPGMSVEQVLAAAIEPPDPARVDAAMKDLQMVGALDSEKNLTSLGRVLLQLPVDVQMGRLVLYGSFFRCLDQALTLAAILTNREPFMSPMHAREEAAQRKNSWSPEGFRSDALAVLRAYNAWWAMQSRGEYISANRFCNENFLSKPTLLLIQKVKVHLLQALYRAGVIEVSAGGEINNPFDKNALARNFVVPPALNANKDSYPLLTALIAIATQPKFAIRLKGTEKSGYRTSRDKFALIHPSSVNHRKHGNSGDATPEKQLFAFAEKRQNNTQGSGQTFLVNTTRLDPLSYILFGAYSVEVVESGLECDNWLPIVGDVRTLDDVQRLKQSMEACMLRVFEGITMSRQRKGQHLPILPREEEGESESGDEGEDMRDYSLSREEVKELDVVTTDIVNLLDSYSDERLVSQSVHNSRAGTPMGSPFSAVSRLPGTASGYTTPSYYQSRPGTPSRLRRF
ncbi:unnamed protein product [Cyclocybe aegerita]|uniref:P-loop containing nucleoside triphosphate hydrolase protein n=1 Tax=Cyclocybe aegerita TaxID=1973307 RepID=A0A8S0W7B8_CYCAE|nr:unnamed protein product [Cyclocybe aegerita]